MTDLDKTIKVLCSFEQNDQTVTLNKNNPNKPSGLDVKTNVNARNNEIDGPNSIVTNTAAPPTIVMKILDRTGNEANYVNLGDELILKIEIKERTNSPFGIFARNLFAKSSNNEVLHLLDSDGCPIDHSVFPEMKIDPVDKVSLHSKFKAFRFPSTGVVNFEVQIKFCPGKCEQVRCNSNNQEQIVQSNYGNVIGLKSNFGRRRREALNEFEAEQLEANESNLKPTIIKKAEVTKEFKEVTLPVKNEDFIPALLPKPQFLQSNLQEINSTKPKPELSQQVIANSNGYVYPPPNSDLLSYTVSYQPNHHSAYNQQRDAYSGYSSGNGYSYVDPILAGAKNGYLSNQFYGNSHHQEYQPFNSSSYLMNNMINNNLMSIMPPSNQIYNPFAYSSSNSLNSFNNFGKMNSIRPMTTNENNMNNKNYWNHQASIHEQSNKPVNNLVNSPPNIVNNHATNKVKFVPPRPLSRPDGLPAVPKVTKTEGK